MVVTFIGRGGHSRDLADIAFRSMFLSILYVEAHTPQQVAEAVKGSDGYVLAMNDSATRGRLDYRNLPSTRLVDPTAAVADTVRISEGVAIGANTSIGPSVFLGRHTHINANAFVTRSDVGDYVTIAPGATVCGDVTIGDGVMVGAGAVISNLCQIGDRAVIGAGAVVPPRTTVPPGETWVGVPAKALP